MTEIRKLVNTSPIGIHLLSAGGLAVIIVYYILEQIGTIVRKFNALDIDHNSPYTKPCK